MVKATDAKPDAAKSGKFPAGKAIDSNRIADEMAAQQPAASEHAIDAQREQDKKHAVDPDGKAFDPELHEVDADGNPDLSVHGTLKRRRGRKLGDKNKPKATRSKLAKDRTRSARQSVADEEAKRIAAEQARISASAATGRAAANALFMMGVVIGGSEWQPMTNAEFGLDEAATLEGAFAEYFLAKGIDDLPPGVALAIAIAGYALPRLQMPQTQQRIKAAATWSRSKLSRNTINGTRLDSRHDRKRENDSSQAPGPAISDPQDPDTRLRSAG